MNKKRKIGQKISSALLLIPLFSAPIAVFSMNASQNEDFIENTPIKLSNEDFELQKEFIKEIKGSEKVNYKYEIENTTINNIEGATDRKDFYGRVSNSRQKSREYFYEDQTFRIDFGLFVNGYKVETISHTTKNLDDYRHYQDNVHLNFDYSAKPNDNVSVQIIDMYANWSETSAKFPTVNIIGQNEYSEIVDLENEVYSYRINSVNFSMTYYATDEVGSSYYFVIDPIYDVSFNITTNFNQNNSYSQKINSNIFYMSDSQLKNENSVSKVQNHFELYEDNDIIKNPIYTNKPSINSSTKTIDGSFKYSKTNNIYSNNINFNIPIRTLNFNYFIKASSLSSTKFLFDSQGHKRYWSNKPITHLTINPNFIRALQIMKGRENVKKSLDKIASNSPNIKQLKDLVDTGVINIFNLNQIKSMISSNDYESIKNLKAPNYFLKISSANNWKEYFSYQDYLTALKDASVNFTDGYGDQKTIKINELIDYQYKISDEQVDKSSRNRLLWENKLSNFSIKSDKDNYLLENSLGFKLDIEEGDLNKFYGLDLKLINDERSVIHKYYYQAHNLDVSRDVSFIMADGTVLDQDYKVVSSTTMKVGDVGYKQVRYKHKTNYLIVYKDKDGDWYSDKHEKKLKELDSNFNEQDIEYVFNQEMNLIINPYSNTISTNINPNKIPKGIKAIPLEYKIHGIYKGKKPPKLPDNIKSKIYSYKVSGVTSDTKMPLPNGLGAKNLYSLNSLISQNEYDALPINIKSKFKVYTVKFNGIIDPLSSLVRDLFYSSDTVTIPKGLTVEPIEKQWFISGVTNDIYADPPIGIKKSNVYYMESYDFLSQAEFDSLENIQTTFIAQEPNEDNSKPFDNPFIYKESLQSLFVEYYGSSEKLYILNEDHYNGISQEKYDLLPSNIKSKFTKNSSAVALSGIYKGKLSEFSADFPSEINIAPSKYKINGITEIDPDYFNYHTTTQTNDSIIKPYQYYWDKDIPKSELDSLPKNLKLKFYVSSREISGTYIGENPPILPSGVTSEVNAWEVIPYIVKTKPSNLPKWVIASPSKWKLTSTSNNKPISIVELAGKPRYALKTVSDIFNGSSKILESWDDGFWSHATQDDVAVFDGVFGSDMNGKQDGKGLLSQGHHKINISLLKSNVLKKNKFNIVIDFSPVEIEVSSNGKFKKSKIIHQSKYYDLYYSNEPINLEVKDLDIASAKSYILDSLGNWYEIPINTISKLKDGTYYQFINSTMNYQGFAKVIIIDRAGNKKIIFLKLDKSGNEKPHLKYLSKDLYQKSSFEGNELFIFNKDTSVQLTDPLAYELKLEKIDKKENGKVTTQDITEENISDYVFNPSSDYSYGKTIENKNSKLSYVGDELKPFIKNLPSFNEWKTNNSKIDLKEEGLYKLTYKTKLINKLTVTKYFYINSHQKIDVFKYNTFEQGQTQSFYLYPTQKESNLQGTNISDKLLKKILKWVKSKPKIKKENGIFIDYYLLYDSEFKDDEEIWKYAGSKISAKGKIIEDYSYTDDKNSIPFIKHFSLNLFPFEIKNIKVKYSLLWISDFVNLPNPSFNNEGKYKITITDLYGNKHYKEFVLLDRSKTTNDRVANHMLQIYSKQDDNTTAFWKGKVIWWFYRYEDANHAVWEQNNFVNEAMRRGLSREDAETAYEHIKRDPMWNGDINNIPGGFTLKQLARKTLEDLMRERGYKNENGSYKKIANKFGNGDENLTHYISPNSNSKTAIIIGSSILGSITAFGSSYFIWRRWKLKKIH